LDNYSQALGARLRAVRNQQRLSLQGVEEKSAGRWKAVVIGSYERGDRAISVTRLAALAEFYGMPVGELLPTGHGKHSGDPAAIVVLDLEKLRQLAAHQTGSAARYTATVQNRCDDHGGRVMSIWNEHVKVFAMAYEVHPGELTDQLIEWAVLAPRPAVEGEVADPMNDSKRAGPGGPAAASSPHPDLAGRVPTHLTAAASAVVAEAVAIAAEAQTRIAAEVQAEAAEAAAASAAAVAAAADRTARAAETARTARATAFASAAQAAAATAAQTAAAVQHHAEAAAAKVAVAAAEAAALVAASATPHHGAAPTASLLAAIVAAAAADNVQATAVAAEVVAQAVAAVKAHVKVTALAAEAALQHDAFSAASAVSKLANETAERIADSTTARAARTTIETTHSNTAALIRLNELVSR